MTARSWLAAVLAIAWSPAPRCTCGGGVCGTRKDGKVRIRVYLCRGCRRRVPWCFGAADERPELCDDCWAAARAGEGAAA